MSHFTIRTNYRGLGRPLYYMKGFHAVVRPRGNPTQGMRNTLNIAIWSTLIEAIAYCMNQMDEYYDWGYGMSDAVIEPFDGMVST